VKWIENYPGFVEGVAGPALAPEIVNQAIKCGVVPEVGEVIHVTSDEFAEKSCWKVT
jgi:thioredoxin reductase